jgi:chaperonin cofactor prefoldin
MANLGTQAAAEIDTQISNFRSLQEELGQYNANFGTLMAQRNENEMVLKELEVCQAEDGEGGESVVYKQVR